MYKRMFALVALAIALLVTPSWASACSPEEGLSCTNTFSPGVTTNTYDFSGTGDGVLTVHFVTVLTTFRLTVTVNHTIDPFDPSAFPEGTVAVTYCNGRQDQYDFSGNPAVTKGPNGVPVKGTDYRGLINILLSYFTCQAENYTPAFAHAPGDSTTFTEDILAFYSPIPFSEEPTMDGNTPGLSSLSAARESLIETDSFCFVSPTEGKNFTVGQEIEVAFRLTDGADCNSGKPVRDKTARLSLAMTDCNGHFVSFPRLRNKEEGNKFHFDHEDGVNEFDLSTKGLAAPGCYTITVFGSKFSVQSVDITLTPGTDTDDPD